LNDTKPIDKDHPIIINRHVKKSRSNKTLNIGNNEKLTGLIN